MSGQRIKPEVVKAFMKRCVSIRTFQGEGMVKELSVCVNLQGIVDFYMTSLGTPPFVTTWEEIRQCLLIAVHQAKNSKPEGYEVIVRLTGRCSVWLAIKIYSVFVYEVDRIFYAGDVLIRL